MLITLTHFEHEKVCSFKNIKWKFYTFLIEMESKYFIRTVNYYIFVLSISFAFYKTAAPAFLKTQLMSLFVALKSYYFQ